MSICSCWSRALVDCANWAKRSVGRLFAHERACMRNFIHIENKLKNLLCARTVFQLSIRRINHTLQRDNVFGRRMWETGREIESRRSRASTHGFISICVDCLVVFLVSIGCDDACKIKFYFAFIFFLVRFYRDIFLPSSVFSFYRNCLWRNQFHLRFSTCFASDTTHCRRIY